MAKNTFSRIAAVVVTLAIFVLVIAPLGVFAETTPMIWDGSAAQEFESGSGAKNDPFIIKTGEQLALLAQNVLGSLFYHGPTYEDFYFKLDADIVLNDTSDWENWGTNPPKNKWIPIGGEYESSTFKGHFDGNGHTISGLYIDTNNSGPNYESTLFKGLFGRISYPATVTGVGIEKSYIYADAEVGAVVGENKGGTIESCFNKGIVRAFEDKFPSTTWMDIDTCGGVVGYSGSLGSHKPIVRNCFNAGSVRGTVVGGVVGGNYGGTIENCYNIGAVTGTSKYIGAIVGDNTSDGNTVKNCYYLKECAWKKSGATCYGVGFETSDTAGETKVLTDEEMKRQANFVGFDFSEIWTMEGQSDYPYPELMKKESKYLKGDVNGDGQVDAFDYQMLKAYVLGTFPEATAEMIARMDVNDDHSIDAFDYQMVKAHVLGTYVLG